MTTATSGSHPPAAQYYGKSDSRNDLLPSGGGGHGGPSYLKLRARREALEELWRQGISGRALLIKHTELLDKHLKRSFADCPEGRDSFALIALGGYGRRELFPFSDIDLMLLYEPGAEKELNTVAEAILYPLWDAGLDVGHAVRTPEACIADAKKDFFFEVAMLDARLVAGSKPLFDNLQMAFHDTFIEGRRPEFLQNMMTHRAKRHQQYGLHSYLLEPHIKESRGGFRDIQAMLWTARVVFGLLDLTAMQEAGLLSADEQRSFAEAWEHLIRIRNRLHYISGRKNDQLYFEHQEDMAKAFDYQNEKNMLAVEHFMRNVYTHMQTVSVITDLFFEHVHEVLGLTSPATQDRILEPGIEVRHDRIQLTDPDLLQKKPALFMRLFSQSAKTGIPIHHRSRKHVTSHLHLLDDKLRYSRRLAIPFLETLQHGKHSQCSLEAMLETGLLSEYIPEFAKVKSLVQHDVYHILTVDRHLLQTVGELQKLKEEEENIFMAVGSPHILFLAGLLHDIGKGHGQGHAERGATIAVAIGARMGLNRIEQELLSFLVGNHLFLSHTALRRDLEDEEFIIRCARQVQTPEKLAMLYLLSIADARATGPSVWNDWKAVLLQELYLKIALLLERKDPIDEGYRTRTKQGAKWMREKIAMLLEEGERFDLQVLPDDYLVSFTPEIVVKHIEYRRELEKQQVLFFHEDRKEAWSLLIVTRDRPGLLAKIFGVFALHNINALAAQIFTWGDGTVVDTFDVTSIISQNYEVQDWESLQKDLFLAVRHRLGLEHRLSRKLPPLRKKTDRMEQRLEVKAVVDNETSEMYTVIEVYAKDRLGMLYDITRTLADFGINIFRAKIGARADQVVDVFYVLDYDGNKIEDKAFQEEIRQGLLYAVSG